MRTVTRYACEICDCEYTKESEAAECEAQGILDMRAGSLPVVGDIIETGLDYGWHSNPDTIWARKQVTTDERWSGNGDPDRDVAQGGSRMYARIFIISAITLRGHEKIYHLYCPEPPQGPLVVYTCRGHVSMTFAEPSLERTKWAQDNKAEWHGKVSKRGSLT